MSAQAAHDRALESLQQRVGGMRHKLNMMGGDRMSSGQGTFGKTLATNWELSPNVCQAGLADQVFTPSPLRGGDGSDGHMNMSETYFAQKPVGYTGVMHSPWVPKAKGGSKKRSSRKTKRSKRTRKTGGKARRSKKTSKKSSRRRSRASRRRRSRR